MATWILLDIPLLSLLCLLLHLTQSTVRGSLTVQVQDIKPTSATVSWQTSSDDVTITVTLQHRGNHTNTWSITDDSQRSVLLEDLTENSDYITCVQSRDVVNGSESSSGDLICRQFDTPFSSRTIAALLCATYLIFSFVILTVLDFICGSIRDDDYEIKQEELLEQGYKTFKKSRKAKRKAAKLAQKRQQNEQDGDDLVEDNMNSNEPLRNSADSVVKDFRINQWLESGIGTSSDINDSRYNRLSAPPEIKLYGVAFDNDDDVSSIMTQQGGSTIF